MVPLVVLAVGLIMLVIERARPGRPWPEVRGWWFRAIVANALQAGAVLTIGRACEPWLARHRPFSADVLGTTGGALVGYFVLTFVYYWWHRARHESPLLWRWLHQFHHSASRIELVTSFYKHPLELVTNSVIPSAVFYLGVGLGPEAAVGASLLSGLAELFYHWNVKTPRWVGYLIQRPEAHCVHHEYGVHAKNYGDLPIWDLLFGTFDNPAVFDRRCGLDGEDRIGDLLKGRDLTPVVKPARKLDRVAVSLFFLGVAQMTGDVTGLLPLKAVAAATAASPAPKVFCSSRGLETFSTRFALEYRDTTGVLRIVRVDGSRRLSGPYNRRNVYGAVLAFGPVLASDPRTRPLLETVAARSLGGEAPLLRELGLDPATIAGPIRVRWEPLPTTHPEGLPLELEVRR